jgi:hypothetical protein
MDRFRKNQSQPNRKNRDFPRDENSKFAIDEKCRDEIRSAEKNRFHRIDSNEEI